MEYIKKIKIDLATKQAKKVVVGDLLEQEKSDLLQARRKAIFKNVCNKKNWKFRIDPIECDSKTEAEILADAIISYVGGVEIKFNTNGKWQVSSKGYYHYIGA